MSNFRWGKCSLKSCPIGNVKFTADMGPFDIWYRGKFVNSDYYLKRNGLLLIYNHDNDILYLLKLTLWYLIIFKGGCAALNRVGVKIWLLKKYSSLFLVLS